MITCDTPARCSASRVLPRTGRPRPGGRLDHFIGKRDTTNDPVFDDGLVYVSVEGQHPRKAVIGERDYLRITARDPSGPRLTRTRWFLDDANMLRAYSLHEQPLTHGVLVAAAVLGAKDGDSIEMPADPFDVRVSQLRRLPPEHPQTPH